MALGALACAHHVGRCRRHRRLPQHCLLRARHDDPDRHGERPIESLRAGMTCPHPGRWRTEVAQPVKWVGHRRIDLTSHPRPETVAPIRIQRGAFADNMPHRDLLVSPDHAIFVDGMLICARQLVNGTTIRQERDWTAVDYYHVELDEHAILLAEGLPAESYLDTGNRGFFANSGAPLVLHPDLTDETDYPTREAGSCAPFVWDEASVQPVWQRLADRAAAIGRPVPQRVTTTDAGAAVLCRSAHRQTGLQRQRSRHLRPAAWHPRGAAGLTRAIADRGASLAGGSSPAWRAGEAHRAARR